MGGCFGFLYSGVFFFCVGVVVCGWACLEVGLEVCLVMCGSRMFGFGVVWNYCFCFLAVEFLLVECGVLLGLAVLVGGGVWSVVVSLWWVCGFFFWGLGLEVFVDWEVGVLGLFEWDCSI